MFIRLLTPSRLPRSRGAVIALVKVGQRDTKWLVPLTVSGGYQGEEGNHTYQALHIPTIVAPFIFFHKQTVWPTHDCGLVKDCG
jgi:hypothetical protein